MKVSIHYVYERVLFGIMWLVIAALATAIIFEITGPKAVVAGPPSPVVVYEFEWTRIVQFQGEGLHAWCFVAQKKKALGAPWEPTAIHCVR